MTVTFKNVDDNWGFKNVFLDMKLFQRRFFIPKNKKKLDLIAKLDFDGSVRDSFSFVKACFKIFYFYLRLSNKTNYLKKKY
jgi:hypothetical protein